MKKKLKLTTIAIIWGFTFGATKLGLQYSNPYTYNFFRFLISTLILLPFVKKLSRRELNITILFSLTYSLSVLFQTLSLRTNQTINTSILMGFNIIVTATLGYIFLKEKPKAIKILTIIIGISLITKFKYFFNGTGDLYALVSSLFYGTQIFLVSFISKESKVDYISILFYQSVTAMVLNSVLIFVYGMYVTVTPILIGSLLYNSIFSFIIVAIIQFKYQKYVNAYEASIIYLFSDIIIIILGFALGEQINELQFIGCVLIIITPFIDIKRLEIKKGS